MASDVGDVMKKQEEMEEAALRILADVASYVARRAYDRGFDDGADRDAARLTNEELHAWLATLPVPR